MTTTLNAAQSYNGTLSNAALKTFGDIAASIDYHATLNAWDRANSHMRSALMQAKNNAKGKAAFLKLAKQATGIAKNSHPLLVWCVANWY